MVSREKDAIVAGGADYVVEISVFERKYFLKTPFGFVRVDENNVTTEVDLPECLGHIAHLTSHLLYFDFIVRNFRLSDKSMTVNLQYHQHHDLENYFFFKKRESASDKFVHVLLIYNPILANL